MTGLDDADAGEAPGILDVADVGEAASLAANGAQHTQPFANDRKPWAV